MAKSRRKFLKQIGGGALASAGLFIPGEANAFFGRRRTESCMPSVDEHAMGARELVGPLLLAFPAAYTGLTSATGNQLSVFGGDQNAPNSGMFYTWGLATGNLANNQPSLVTLVDISGAALAGTCGTNLNTQPANTNWWGFLISSVPFNQVFRLKFTLTGPPPIPPAVLPSYTSTVYCIMKPCSQ